MTSVETVWQHTPHEYELPADEVHVWRVRLDWPQNCIDGLLQVLSTQERERADRFHFDTDRKRAIIGRGLARLLLGHCLNRPPDELQIEYNEFGKPALSAVHHSLLQFNVSHAGDLILVALAEGRKLGVDVEQMRTGFAIDAVAARFFSLNERRALAAIAPESRCEAFFSCWTRKEAYLKGRGEGLSLPLHHFDVAFGPGEEPRLLETRHDPAEAKRWTLHAFDPGHGCNAALAIESSGLRLKCWDCHALPFFSGHG
jgi:4'-phosphopantetheinyl transferase